MLTVTATLCKEDVAYINWLNEVLRSTSDCIALSSEIATSLQASPMPIHTICSVSLSDIASLAILSFLAADVVDIS